MTSPTPDPSPGLRPGSTHDPNTFPCNASPDTASPRTAHTGDARTGTAPAREDPVARLTPQLLAAVVQDVARQAHLDATAAQQLKFTNNAVIALTAAGAVVRVAGSTTIRRRVPAVLAAARLFTDHAIPAVRLWPEIDQPLTAQGQVVTLWQLPDPGGPAPTPGDLARILRAVHAIDQPLPASIPRWNLTAGIRQRLADADGVPAHTLTYLAEELAALETTLPRLDDIKPLLPPGLLHGDAHLGNLIPTPRGPVICDFDSTATGPREWDLIPAAVGTQRFGYTPDVHQGLAHAYGVDITTWPGYDILRRLREFQLITSVLPVLGANPALRPQWQHRLNTYSTGDTHSPWTPYADITDQRQQQTGGT